MGQGFIYHLHSDLGFCITFSTLSVSTKIALLVSWGVSLHLCFHILAQLHEDSFNFTHTPHQHSQVSTLPHVYNTCAHALNAHTNLSVTNTHTYKLTTLCVELWITNYACTKNTLRLLQRLVVPFSRASMIQVTTHLEQQPSVQILSKIIITQQRSCSINKVCNRRNSGNFIENKFIPVAVYYWTCDSTHPISYRYH